MKKKLVTLLVASVLTLTMITACGQKPESGVSSAPEKQNGGGQQTEQKKGNDSKIVLKFGSGSPVSTPEVKAVEEFAKVLSELSGGSMQVDVLAGGLVGGDREIVEGQLTGTLDFSVVCGILQNYDPALMVLEYDMLFKGQEHLNKVFNGPVGEKIYKRVEDKVGLKVLAPFKRAPRLVTSNKAINTVDDLKGLKIRVPEMPARVAIWKALGASPTPMSFNEVFTALQTNTIDGQENPISNIYSSRIFEVSKYLALSGHLYNNMLFTMSKEKYDSFTDEQKAWINEAAEKAKAYNDKLTDEVEQAQLKEVSEKMTVTKPDITSWREKAKDVYRQFEDKEGFIELYTAIVEAGEK